MGFIANHFVKENFPGIELVCAKLARCRSCADLDMIREVVAWEAFLAARALGWRIAIGLMLVKLVQRLDNLAEDAVCRCMALCLVLVDHLLGEFDHATATLGRALALKLVRVEIAHWILVSTNATSDRLVTGRFMPFNVWSGEVQVAKTAPDWLIAVFFMVFKFGQGFLLLTKATAGCAADPTMRGRVASFHQIETDWAFVIRQLRVLVVVGRWWENG